MALARMAIVSAAGMSVGLASLGDIVVMKHTEGAVDRSAGGGHTYAAGEESPVYAPARKPGGRPARIKGRPKSFLPALRLTLPSEVILGALGR